ncbi:MAG: Gar1/Naf1 family protein [Candidatus Methanomethylophilaceae archaeon]|nr:Gar1/Naf1 family protein [Candidatus Methanomethylophilaceae archaeon]MDD3379370.1 Gar1/Naf1 family protein [Candidatus Methanomethylophilaceae archaeon]MDY0223813.1 Gar1/Naf1 family protein [Candidatus Methanomethylophilaceae archaeon]
MDFLGIVEEVTSDGKAVVRSETLPDVGNLVFDQRERRVGTVKRIFGPVDEPYVSITIEDKTLIMGLKEKKLYFTKGTQNGKDKRRNRRN